MSNALVPVTQDILIPHDWRQWGMVVSVPGVLGEYTGPAALVLTDNALHLCGRNTAVRTIPFDNIREVSVCDLRGIAVARHTATGVVYANPQEAFGIDVSYEPPGGMRRHIRVLVYFYNAAAQWVDEIGDAADAFYHALGAANGGNIQRRYTK